MDQTQLRYLLALWLMPKIGPVLQKKILQHCPILMEFFKLSRTELIQIGFKSELIEHILQPDWHAVDATLEWAAHPRQHLITYTDAAYPEQLKQIYAAPLVLLAHGQLEVLQSRQIAIVGSRNPTPAGLKIAKEYAAFLARQGLVITSGLALGIDAAAHQGALTVGSTIAVIGTGIDVIYPKQHRDLTEIIAATGLVVSEFPLHMQPQALNFPRRNRIISGLSLGTFVVEASMRSGSLITAKYAVEQGREVFAMPSSIHNPMAKGCHWLIKQGATLIESVEDIWQHIQPPIAKSPQNRLLNNNSIANLSLDFSPSPLHISKALTKSQQHLLDIIGFDTISIQYLAEQISLNIEQISVVLLELELKGCIVTVPGGYQRTV